MKVGDFVCMPSALMFSFVLAAFVFIPRLLHFVDNLLFLYFALFTRLCFVRHSLVYGASNYMGLYLEFPFVFKCPLIALIFGMKYIE